MTGLWTSRHRRANSALANDQTLGLQMSGPVLSKNTMIYCVIVFLSFSAMLFMLVDTINNGCNFKAYDIQNAIYCGSQLFYRFQTLIAALIAIITATIAIRPAIGQLRQARRQAAASAVGAMISSVRAQEEANILVELAFDLAYVRCINYLESVYKNTLRIDKDEISEIRENCSKHFAILVRSLDLAHSRSNDADRNRMRHEIGDRAKTLLECVGTAISAHGEVSRALDQQTGGLDAARVLFRQKIDKLKKSFEDYDQASKALGRVLEEDIRSRWSLIAEQEREAISDN